MNSEHINTIIRQENGFLRIVLPDSIGILENQALEKEILKRHIEKKMPLVLDFSDTSMIYSSGIGLLIRLRKIMGERECQIYFVNVAKKIRDMFTMLNLDRIFPIFSTDAEFDISVEKVWNQKVTEKNAKFIFIAQVEKGIYRMTLSGQMSSLQDLSRVSEFKPKPEIALYIFNLENLDLIDTYGAQLFSDFIERIHQHGSKSIFYGANSMIRDLFGLFPALSSDSFFTNEQQALESLK